MSFGVSNFPVSLVSFARCETPGADGRLEPPSSSAVGVPRSLSGDPLPRVWITGLGLVTPLGSDRESSWARLQAGECGLRWLPELLVTGAPAAPSRNRGSLIDEPVVELARTAADEAVRDADLSPSVLGAPRAGCVVGTSKGGFRGLGRHWPQWRKTHQAAPDWSQSLPNAAALAVARDHGLGGPVLCPVAACATGLLSVSRGVDLIQQGVCDIVLAGSSDAALEPLLLASYRRLGVLADRGAKGALVRPFDVRRNGFLAGEGAAILVLESASHATTRGAKPYAEWLAGGQAADPYDLTRMDAEPSSLIRLLEDLFLNSGIDRQTVDYVNLHGTGTQQNDLAETRALHAVFGEAAASIPCSSLKGALGHLLGAAGSVELACTLLALRDGVVPPTLNLQQPDPQCDLDYTPGRSRRASLQTALKLSLGFGGHLAAALVRRTAQCRSPGEPPNMRG